MYGKEAKLAIRTGEEGNKHVFKCHQVPYIVSYHLL
jgi:hypothetical protein